MLLETLVLKVFILSVLWVLTQYDPQTYRYFFLCLQVIFRWWRITHRNAETQRLSPGEIKECHEDFLNDDRTQSKLRIRLG